MIGVGLAGYGLAGRIFHAPLIDHVDGLELRAIATSRAGDVVADGYAARVCQWQALMTAPDIDLVVIATPNLSHFALAREALEKSKAVVIDKPLTTTLDEARQLFDLADRHQRFLSVFHNRRWDDDFSTLSGLVAGGVLGDVSSLESSFDRFRPTLTGRWREQAGPGAGLWWDLGPHLVDQAIKLMGVPEWVHADLECQRAGSTAPDYFQVTLEYGRSRAVLSASVLALAPRPRFRVLGEKAAFVCEGLDAQEGLQLARSRGQTSLTPPNRVGRLVRQDAGIPVDHTVRLRPGRYEAFYEAVRDAIDHGADPPVSARDTLLGIRILETADRSAKERRALPLK